MQKTHPAYVDCNGHCNTASLSFPTPAANPFHAAGHLFGHSKSDAHGNSPVASYQPHPLPSSCRTGIGVPRTHCVLWLWTGALSTHMGCILYKHCPSSKPLLSRGLQPQQLLNTSTKNKPGFSAWIEKGRELQGAPLLLISSCLQQLV